MKNLQNKINLANIPTKIEYMKRFSKKVGKNIYIKRDDETGSEISGNKVRKLEYVIKDALDKGCDTLITCGGIQSNHARATAVAAAKLGLNAYLVLRKKPEDETKEGNYFIDNIIGAKIKLITAEEYSNSRMEIMNALAEDLRKEGLKPYVIPEGASDPIGTLGYFNAMEEIKEQEKELGIKFDMVVTAVGSGGTYAGLFMSDIVDNSISRVYGVNVCDDAEYFKNKAYEFVNGTKEIADMELKVSKEQMNIIDGYVGVGYAKSTKEELDFIHELAKMEGIILDPVYTGKAMFGLVNEIEKGSFKEVQNILFVHTGGLFGLFPKESLFEF